MQVIARWALFFLVGLPVQIVVYVVYLPVAWYFHTFLKPKIPNTNYAAGTTGLQQIHKYSDLLVTPNDRVRDIYFLDDPDGHTALVHCHLWGLKEYAHLAERALTMFVRPDGGLYRYVPVNHPFPVSGDCLATWVFSYVVSGTKKPELVMRVAWHYLKNCFGITTIDKGVSARCSNGGVSYAFDAWKKINQPCFGPQYYTSQALFVLAAHEAPNLWDKLFWQVISILHYILMGGWLWWVSPLIHDGRRTIYYVQHITMLNLYVISKLGSWTPLNDFAIRAIAKGLMLKNNVNAFFWALMWDTYASRSETERRVAMAWLCAIPIGYGFLWQREPANDDYFKGMLAQNPNGTLYMPENQRFLSPLTFVARLLNTQRGKHGRGPV